MAQIGDNKNQDGQSGQSLKLIIVALDRLTVAKINGFWLNW
jgi:hypothetical protein